MRRLSADERVAIGFVLATVVGFALRLAAARGDLGLDEVWSLNLIARLDSLGAVFWGLPHDNNHALNSAWLYLLGPGRPDWLTRLPAVVFGTLTVPAFGLWLRRRSPAAGLIGAALAAVALPLVDFGSEARGYAGLVLASVLAMDACERAVEAALAGDRRRCRRASWSLGLWVGFGAFNHLAMAATAAVLGVTILASIAWQVRRPRPVLQLVARILLPSALLLAPAAACLLVAIVRGGGFRIGDVDPFSIGKLAQGYGGMLLLTSGLPDAVPAAAVPLTLGALAIVARRRLATPPSLILATAALVILPSAVAAARLPNVTYSRYFAVCGIVLLALQAEALGSLWRQGGAERRAAIGGLLALLAGGLTLDALELRDGRGGFSSTLALLQAEETSTYATDHPIMTDMLLAAAARRGGRGAPPVPTTSACGAAPDWYIATGLYDTRPDGTATIGPAACRTTYRVRAAFSASPLSGTQWTLYRRAAGPEQP